MASNMRPLRALQNLRLPAPQRLAPTRQARSLLTTTTHSPTTLPSPAASRSRRCAPRPTPLPRPAPFHTHARAARRAQNNGEEIPDSAPTTDFGRMDMLGQTPAPATSVDICSSDGFTLNSGVAVYDGKGVLLVGGEAFEWQPWATAVGGGQEMRLLNAKGQWEVPADAWGLLDLLWPRPDLLILGLGAEMHMLSPATKRHLTDLGLRVEVLDTRNAASQFNMLATERGVDNVAAALIPIGWKEGLGANWD